jgi:hypothetical protein
MSMPKENERRASFSSGDEVTEVTAKDIDLNFIHQRSLSGAAWPIQRLTYEIPYNSCVLSIAGW